jgi:hypothetical protein
MLEPVDRDLWTIASEVRMPGGVPMPVRSTVVRLPDGGVWIHAPVHLDDATATAIDALGPVRYLVAPNALHHLFLGDAARRWPSAEVWVARGVVAKQPGLGAHRTLDEPAPWADVLDQVHLAGAPSIDETVFLHRPTRTLIVTDLLFHVVDSPSRLTPWMLRLTGTWGKLAVSRLWSLARRDRAALADAVDQVLAWPVARLIPAHGSIVDSNAPTRVAEALHRLARR